MESYSLYQVNEYIRRVVALNFREPIWIEAEIAQAKNSRGNYYIELVEKEENGEKVIAQSGAVVWYRNFNFIKKKIGDVIYDLLQDGTQVRLKCRVDFHERYGLKLVIEDLDPNYTFGKLELKRQQIINQLEEEGLMELNKSLLLPDVIQHIAVISSAQAAGYQDFANHLNNNPYGYTFKIDLYDCAVQGINVERDIVAAINEIRDAGMHYHAVTIIRGGGSKLDLSGFDSYAIAKAIAIGEQPFIIGIGHDIDSTVVDLVACLSVKTPTAVADFIVDRNARFEGQLTQVSQLIGRQSARLISREELELSGWKDQLWRALRSLLDQERLLMDQLERSIVDQSTYIIQETSHSLEKIKLQVTAFDPEVILNRGYAYIKKGKQIVSSTQQLNPLDKVTITVKDGSAQAEILHIKK